MKKKMVKDGFENPHLQEAAEQEAPCLWFSQAAKSILTAPITLTNYALKNPGKTLMSFLALQSQCVSAQTKPVFNRDGGGVQHTSNNGNSRTTVQYNPYNGYVSGEYRRGNNNNHVYVKGSIHDSVDPDSASVEMGFRTDVGKPKKRD